MTGPRYTASRDVPDITEFELNRSSRFAETRGSHQLIGRVFKFIGRFGQVSGYYLPRIFGDSIFGGRPTE